MSTAVTTPMRPRTRPSTGILIGEYVGSLIIGCAGYYAVYSGELKPGTTTNVAAAFGFGLFVAALLIAGVHGNPLVSVGAAMSRTISWAEAGLRSIVQLLGFLTAVWFMTLVHDEKAANVLYGVPVPVVKTSPVLVFFWAAVAGFGFVLVVLWASTRGRFLGAIIAGFALYLAIYYSASLTGGGVNTARNIAPMIVSGVWLWAATLGELFGAALAGLAYRPLSQRI